MRVIDLHCDVLYKMTKDDSLSFENASELDANLTRLRQGQVALQCFAVFCSLARRASFYDILDAIDVFRQRVLCFDEISWVETKEQLQEAVTTGKTGALLTLEGVEGLEGDPSFLRHAYQLGIRMVGLTWNYANWAADGVMEQRGAGLTANGVKFVQECEKTGLIIDVSHLSEQAFWEVCQFYQGPIVASHSNAYKICPHPRNLNDHQIIELIQRKGLIGVTFVPFFLNSGGEATLSDIIKHIDHVCALGGSRHLAFGSDFDGIEQWTKNLEHAGKYVELREKLSKYYKEDLLEGFLWKNAYDFLYYSLPSSSI